MLYAGILSLFIIATTTSYVLIKYARRHFAVFVLIPLLISSSLLSYTAITALAGTPIKGYPPGEFQVMGAIITKPEIHITVRHADTNKIKTYQIPFSQANANAMNREKELAEKGVSRKGSFQKNNLGDMRYIIDTGNNTPMPPKNVPPNQQTPSTPEQRRGSR